MLVRDRHTRRTSCPSPPLACTACTCSLPAAAPALAHAPSHALPPHPCLPPHAHLHTGWWCPTTFWPHCPPPCAPLPLSNSSTWTTTSSQVWGGEEGRREARLVPENNWVSDVIGMAVEWGAGCCCGSTENEVHRAGVGLWGTGSCAHVISQPGFVHVHTPGTHTTQANTHLTHRHQHQHPKPKTPHSTRRSARLALTPPYCTATAPPVPVLCEQTRAPA